MEVKLTQTQAIRLRCLVNYEARDQRARIEEIKAESDPMMLPAVPALEMDLEKLLELRKILTDAFEQLEFEEVVEL